MHIHLYLQVLVLELEILEAARAEDMVLMVARDSQKQQQDRPMGPS